MVKLQHYQYIDALRGWAVLGVITAHSFSYASQLSIYPVFLVTPRGVQLFFLISALTLMMSWHERNDGISAFYIRRLFRIIPMFWLSIVIYIFWWALIKGHHQLERALPLPEITVSSVISTMSFASALNPESFWGIVPGGWSIGVEMLFYVFFPILAGLLTSFPRAAYFSFATILLWMPITLFQGVLYKTGATNAATYVGLSLPIELCVFSSGILVYWALRVFPRPPQYVSEALVLFGLFLIFFVAFPNYDDYRKLTIGFGFLVWGMGSGGGRYLINAAIKHLGKISYSAYLLHFAMLGAAWWLLQFLDLNRFGPRIFYVAHLSIAVLLTICVSTLSYRFIELPMISIGNRFYKQHVSGD